jgi:predicted restriction endonuclease
MAGRRWTEDETRLAFRLYCELPFGRLHQRNPQIVALAKQLGRTPSSVALKLVNFAHLDPALTARGIKGMSNVSQLDRQVVSEFLHDWERSIERTETIWEKTTALRETPEETEHTMPVAVRRGQSFFRRAVLAAYQSRCCICLIAEERLLVSSHIKPWSVDNANRLNPSNGLSLCALHDRAFDTGLITVVPSMKIRLSAKIFRHAPNALITAGFLQFDGQTIAQPARFAPERRFLVFHNTHVFRGGV